MTRRAFHKPCRRCNGGTIIGGTTLRVVSDAERRTTKALDAERRATRALSLVEMVLSLVILSIVMLGAQSAMIIAARAAPTARSVSEITSQSAGVIDQLTADLQYAKTFTTMSATTVAFTVPDRTGDGQPETIRYEWAGTAGSALTRQFNTNAPVVLAPAVHTFNLIYEKRSRTGTAGNNEGSETILASYDSSSSLKSAAVTSSNWRGQHFAPSLPPDAISWRVTRVYFKARIKGSNQGETRVQIRPAVGGKPSSVVLGETMMFENTLTSSFAWKEIAISQNVQLSPSITACLVLQWENDSDACEVQYRGNLLFGEPVYCFLTGSGTSWNTSNDVMLYYIVGRVTTPAVGLTTYNLTAVRCSLQMPSGSSPLLNTSIRILEEPQVPGP